MTTPPHTHLKARNVLGEALIAPGREAPADEEGKMRASLIEQIHSLEARFATDDQKYICGTASPTAADFTLYAILERLVGNTGDRWVPECKEWYLRP